MSAEIARQAARWAVRYDRGLTPHEAEELARWRAADPRRDGAFIRARAIDLRLDRVVALGPHYDPAQFADDRPGSTFELAGLPQAVVRPSEPFLLPIRKLRPQRLTTRRNLIVGSGVVAAASLACGGFVLLPSLWGRRYAASRGEVKLISLQDGSRMTLNSASAIEVRYSDTARGLKLIGGEALFDVAKSRNRPFIVDAGDVKVTAVGTSFSVCRLVGRPTEVVVREGVVEVSRAAVTPAAVGETLSAAIEPVRLTANQRAIADVRGAVVPEPLSPPEVQALLAWKNGMIAFRHTTLGEAAVEFARYSETAVIIEDPTLASERITGLYSTSDPVGFAQAAAASLDLKTRVDRGGVHIYR